MEEISGQKSYLGPEDLDKLEAKAPAENKKRATLWGIKISRNGEMFES